MRLLAWDLECSSLNADYGVILCAGFKEIGTGNVELLSVADFPLFKSDPTNDRELCKAISKRLMDSDGWVTWYGQRFDVPFLNSRLLYHRLPTLPASHPHIDGWRTAKYRLKLRNNRLVTVQDFLGLATEKDAVKGPIWIKAIAGNRPALQYVINHCKKDVLVLEEAYQRLRPLIIDHPNMNLIGKDGGCPTCGVVGKLQRRGFQVAKTRRYQRYACQSCGAWSKQRQADKVASIRGL